MLATGATILLQDREGQEVFFDLRPAAYKPVKHQRQRALVSGRFKAEKKVVNDHAFLLAHRHRRRRVLPRVPFQDERHQQSDGRFHGSRPANMSTTTASAWSSATRPAECPARSRPAATSPTCSALPKPASSTRSTISSKKSTRASWAPATHPSPVVAAPYGMTLGGGCEVCLAADRIVAHADLFMGLVEIGAGLVPGGCGMINLWRNFMDSKPGPRRSPTSADSSSRPS